MMSTLVISLAVAFGVSFLCSMMEAALLSLTPGQLADLERHRPRVGAIWRAFKANVDRPITVILMLNTTAHTVGATIAGAEFAVLYGDARVGLFSAIFTYLMLQYTEVLPKTLGVRFSGWVAVAIAYPLEFACRALSPLVWLIRLLNHPFEGRRKTDAEAVQVEEITALASYARLSKLISPHQEKIIDHAAHLSRRPVEEVMVPVDEITFLSSAQSLHHAVVAAHMDPHTRFPVTDAGDRDRILGYVNFKELAYRMRTNPADPTLRGVIRPVRFFPRQTTCDVVLRAFLDERAHMAIVQDADGRTVGLVTLEDVIEDLLGPREADFERLPRMLHPLRAGVWMAGGGVPMRELASKLEDPSLDDTRSVDEWLRARLGSPPTLDARVRAGEREFWVRRIRRGRVFEALVMPPKKTDAASSAVQCAAS